MNKLFWGKFRLHEWYLIVLLGLICDFSNAQKFENIVVSMPAKKKFKSDRPFRKMLEYNKMSNDSSIKLLNTVFQNHFANRLGADFIASDNSASSRIAWLRDSVKHVAKSFSPEQFSNKTFEILPGIKRKKHQVFVKRFRVNDTDKKLALAKELRGKQLLAINQINLKGRFMKRGRMKASIHCELFNPDMQQTEVHRLDILLPFRKKMFFSVLEMKLREELTETFK
ncbi:MAG: hypothetical protein ACK4GL_10875 [Flavobacteriales bacterium]